VKTATFRRIPALAGLALLAACRGAGPPAGESDDSRGMEGVWGVELTIQAPHQLAGLPAQRTVSGELALLTAGPTLESAAGLAGRPTLVGSYRLSFRPFGFELHAGDQVPALAARHFAGDSVELALQPGARSTLRLRGRAEGDSVRGRWDLLEVGRGTPGASGSFVMRRGSPGG